MVLNLNLFSIVIIIFINLYEFAYTYNNNNLFFSNADSLLIIGDVKFIIPE